MTNTQPKVPTVIAFLSSPSNNKQQRQQQQLLLPTYKLVQRISIIHTMMRQELTRYKSRHYLDGTITVTEQDRSSLCTWGYDITDACSMNRKVAAIAIGYFDRFMSNRNVRAVEVCLADPKEFQLAFIVSTYAIEF